MVEDACINYVTSVRECIVRAFRIFLFLLFSLNHSVRIILDVIFAHLLDGNINNFMGLTLRNITSLTPARHELGGSLLLGIFEAIKESLSIDGGLSDLGSL